MYKKKHFKKMKRVKAIAIKKKEMPDESPGMKKSNKKK